MYPQKAFSADDALLVRDFLRENSFATIFTHGPNGQRASHVPVTFSFPVEIDKATRSDKASVESAGGAPARGAAYPAAGPGLAALEKGDFVISAHISRQNPQVADIENGPVYLSFLGPHCYVSSRWYGDPATVPTWNYVAVHVTGTATLVEDSHELTGILEHLIRGFDPGHDRLLADLSDEAHERMKKVIVGIRIVATKVDTIWKLSQNQPTDRQERIIEQLASSSREDDRQIARLMKERL